MKLTYTLITFLFSLAVFSQKQITEPNLTKDSDTLGWKKIQDDKIKVFHLPELNKKSDYVFRSWYPGRVLEIIKNNGVVSGKLIYFVFEVWEDNYEADQFVKQYDLPDKKADLLYKYIISSGIEKVPSDKQIEGWKQGFDGITYIYEIKDGANYSFKNYWTPDAQKDVKQAKLIIAFNDELEKIGGFEKYGKKFVEEIPFLHYKYSGTVYYIMKDYSRKEWRKYERNKKMQEKKTRDNNCYIK